MSKKVLNLSKVFLTFAFVIAMLACALTVNFASADSAPLMVDGGSIRYQSQGNSGIRFSAYVPDSLFDDIETKDLKDDVSVGMYLIPATNVGEDVTEIDGQTAGVKKASPTVWAKSDKAGYQQYNVVITGIPETDYATQILASSFIKVGEVEQVSATVVRSIANVANTLLAMDVLAEEGDDMKLDANQVTELGYYAPKAVMLGEVEFHSTSDSSRVATWEAVDNATFYEVEFLDGFVTTTTDTTMTAPRDFKSIKAYGLSNLTAKIFNNVATWNAVDGAVGYLVKTANGIVKTTETSIDLTTETSISVVAYGDGVESAYSNVEIRDIHQLDEMQLVTFDSADYINELSPFAYDTSIVAATNPATEFMTGVGFNPTPKWNETYEEKTGVIDVAVKMANYPGGGCRAGTLTIDLQKGLNLNDYAGIKISINLRGTNGDGDNYLYLAGKTKTQGYTSAYGANGLAAIKVEQGVWTDWYISAADLDTYYDNGDSKITIMTYSVNGYGRFDGRTELLLDDISYYNRLETPKNLQLSDAGMLTWDIVTGAESYTINIDGQDFTTITSNSIDLSTMLSADFAVKVKANSSTVYESEWSESIGYVVTEADVLMAFDSVAYEGTVQLISNNVASPWTNSGAFDFSTISPKVEYQTGVDGANGGDALYIEPVCVSYPGGGARHALFTINLPKALDISGDSFDGIVIRFKFIGTGSAYGANKTVRDTGNVYINLGNVTGPRVKAVYDTYATGSEGYPNMMVTKGEWIEWEISNAELDTLYDGGETQLAFLMVSSTGQEWNAAVPMKTYVDSISYYNN